MTVVSGTVNCEACGREFHLTNEGNEEWPWLEKFTRGVLEGRYTLACPTCEAAQDAEETAAERERIRADRLAQRTQNAAIPPRWRGITWEDVEMDRERADAVRVARLWASGEARQRGLLLHGPVGRGKTYIAAAAAWERLLRKHVRWINVARLMADLRMPFASREYQGAMRSLAAEGRSALVLDDLDKLRPDEQSVQVLYLAVNEWVEQRRWVIVTSNKDPDAIAEDFGPRFGPAIAGRLVEHCNVYPVGGRDRRTDP